MGSGIDLGKLIPSVLFGFFIFAAFTLSFTEMGRDLGHPLAMNASVNFENSLNASRNIESIVMQNATSPGLISSFFPGIPLLMNIVTILKSTTVGVFKDIGSTLDRFFTLLGAHGAGGGMLTILQDIIISAITISVVFIILAALFRQSGFKEK